jgi:hypothetical protein
MATWAALILAPLFALADQGVAYALAPWSCAHQDTVAGHAVHALFLVATLATLAGALRARHAPNHASNGTHRHEFLALVGVLTAALCAAVIVAMWVPQWVLSPCFA